MASEEIAFPGAGDQSLAARLELPAGTIRAAAIFAHCFTCTQQSHAATRVTAALARAGIATLRFDFTGLGGSGGDFGNAGFAGDIADLIAAGEWLRGRIAAPSLLVGHSLGGAAVLAAAHAMPEVRAVATIGAPFDAAHVLHQIEGDRAAIMRDGRGTVRIAGRPFEIGRDFLTALDDSRPAERIAGLRRALLVLHAPLDPVVGIDNAKLIFDAAKHPKSFVTLDDADHLLTNRRDAAYVAGLVAAWAERYLPERESMPTPDGEVRVESGHGAFGTTVQAGQHRWVADEPKRIGGDDLGPSPYDHLLAALGSCTSMTVKYYARREGIAVEDVRVTLRHDRDHGRDCDHCGDDEARVQAIHRTVSISGTTSDADRQRLLAIADRCPVHKTLTGPLHIHSMLLPEK